MFVIKRAAEFRFRLLRVNLKFSFLVMVTGGLKHLDPHLNCVIPVVDVFGYCYKNKY